MKVVKQGMPIAPKTHGMNWLMAGAIVGNFVAWGMLIYVAWGPK